MPAEQRLDDPRRPQFREDGRGQEKEDETEAANFQKSPGENFRKLFLSVIYKFS
jgi:hypothetical protein